MNHPNADNHLKEAAALTRAVEKVMRKFVRLLIGRMSLARLQELIRLVFVQEAEAFLKRERPGKNVAMTKLALLTGLDTRTLGKVKEESETEVAIHENTEFLRDITPECSILDYWQVNPKYLNGEGKPLQLKVKGEFPSFESLFAETITSRGVTSSSLLDRLIASKSVELDSVTEELRMLDGRYWPFQDDDENALLQIGLISLDNLIGTIDHNLAAMQDETDPLFQRLTWTSRLPMDKQSKLRIAIRKLLNSSEEKVTCLLSELEEIEQREGQLTVGVGIYYFEEERSVLSELE